MLYLYVYSFISMKQPRNKLTEAGKRILLYP
nr:MAG TPA: hypothetical protein [Caudoviricetes sp.]